MNYFDQNTGQCKPTAQCSSLQIYSISNNTCSDITNSNLNYPPINSNTICICNQGFTDGLQDQTKPNIVVKCAQSTNGSTSSNQINSGFSSNNSSYYPYPMPFNSTSAVDGNSQLSMVCIN